MVANGRERSEDWMTSRQLAAFLRKHRDNDLRVRMRSASVPILTA